MSNNLKKRFGNNLREYRKDCGMTQEEFAEKLKISASFYANVENGSKAMSMEVLYRLIKNEDVNLNSLLDEDITPATNINEIVSLLNKAPEQDLEFIKNMVKSMLKEFNKQRSKQKK